MSIVHTYDEDHQDVACLMEQCAADLRRLQSCDSFVRDFADIEWQSMGYRDIGPLVGVVMRGPLECLVRIDVRRKPAGFDAMAADARMRAALAAEHIAFQLMGVPTDWGRREFAEALATAEADEVQQ